MLVFALAAAVGCVSYTITRSVLFAELRARIGSHSPMAEMGIKCPYCVAHWVALLFVFLFSYQLPKVTSAPILDGPLYVFLVTWLATIAVAVMSYAMKFVPPPREGFSDAVIARQARPSRCD